MCVWLASPYVKHNKFGPILKANLFDDAYFQGKSDEWVLTFIRLAMLSHDRDGRIPHDSSVISKLLGVNCDIDEMVEEGWWYVVDVPQQHGKGRKGNDLQLRSSSKDPDAVPVIAMPTQNGELVEVYSDWVEAAKTTFPGLDVDYQLSKARFWLENNPSKRKTAKGIPRFLSSWLDRAQNRGSFADRPNAGNYRN